MAIYSIYRITNLVTGKVYIGKTTIDPQLRFKRHQNSASKGSNQYIHRSFRKYGIDKFDFTVIFQSLSNSDLDDFERLFISEYNCCILDGSDKGYNMTRGGDGLDSEAARHYNMLRIADCTHNCLTEEWAEANRQRNADRVADGTHHFLGSTFQDSRVAAGSHPWSGDAGSKHNSDKSKKEISAGTHNFGSAFSTKHNNKRLSAGTHNFTKQATCQYCGLTGKGPNMQRFHGEKCKKNPITTIINENNSKNI